MIENHVVAALQHEEFRIPDAGGESAALIERLYAVVARMNHQWRRRDSL